jgi:peptide chain release factor 2
MIVGAYVWISSAQDTDEAHNYVESLLGLLMQLAVEHHLEGILLSENYTRDIGYSSLSFEVVGNAYRDLLSFVDDVSDLAIVHVSPVFDTELNIDIPQDDIRVENYRRGAVGGLCIGADNRTRVSHIPTGIVVECSFYRSQHKNLVKCMSMLRSRLWDGTTLS